MKTTKYRNVLKPF